MGGDIVKIYVASSWRNPRQPAVVEALRAAGHEVYDFRNPMPGNTGFGWRQCDPRPPSEWSVDDYRRVLETPRAQEGFALDMDALRSSDACVLVLPCGRSAHLELGWAVGAGKRTLVLCEKLDEPELMYLMSQGGANSICASLDELVAAVAAPRPTDEQPAPAAERPGLPAVWDLVQADLANQGRLDVPTDNPDRAYAEVMALVLLVGKLAGSGDVLADMRERDATGRARYGVPLQPHNGRDALVDAYQELLDAAVYLRQHIYERSGL